VSPIRRAERSCAIILAVQRRRVGLVGFFGWGNYGDELFLRIWERELARVGKPEVVHQTIRSPYFIDPPEKVASRYDAFVIGGGDLVIPWSVSKLYWRQEWLSRPVYIAGVGVPTWGELKNPVIEHMRQFFRHPNVRYISTRDPESAAWINQFLAPRIPVQWAPDLVFALDLPPATKPEGAPILSVVTRRRRGGPDDYTQVRRLCERAKESGYRIRQIVLATGSTGKADLEVADDLVVPGKELIYSEDLDEITRAIGESTALASMKFHGTVVATAYGVPSIVLSPTDKSRNLYRMIGQERLLSHLEHTDLPEKLEEVSTPIPASTGADLKDRVRVMIDTLISELAEVPVQRRGRRLLPDMWHRVSLSGSVIRAAKRVTRASPPR